MHFYATSTDGKDWTRHGIVLERDINDGIGADDYSCERPRVIKDESVYKMWYYGRDGDDTSVTTILYATSDDGIEWNKHGVVMARGSSGELDDDAVSVGYVLKEDGIYKMWHGGGHDGISRGFYATSDDGINWVKHGVVLDVGGDGAKDETGAIPCTVINENGRYRMWYVGKDDSRGRIMYAESSEWYKCGVVLDIGESGAPDSSRLNNPYVIKDNDTYKMWYDGSSGSQPRICYAESADGITWEKHGIVLDVDDGDESLRVKAPCVLKEESVYKMWYTAASEPGGCDIFFATSIDGKDWTRSGMVLSRDPDDGIGADDYSCEKPRIIRDGNIYMMWYYGHDDSGIHRILYATSEDGTDWEKHGMVIDRGNTGEMDSDNIGTGPVIKEDGIYKLWYVGGHGGMSRGFFATSEDGISWEKQGVVLEVGGDGIEDEKAVWPSTIVSNNGRYEMWYTSEDGSHRRIMYATTNPYCTKGVLVSEEITIDDSKYRWDFLSLSKHEDEVNTIRITVLDAGNDEPIPGYSGLSGSNISLAFIPTGTYRSIKLMAEFSSAGGVSPQLIEWSVYGKEYSDLSVTENDISPAGELLAGEDNTIQVTVSNIGNDNASADLYLYENEIDEENLIGMTQITVEAASTETYSFNWIPEATGEYTLIAELENIDPMDIDIENNNAENTIIVPPEESTDLSVDYVQVSSESELTEGTEVEILVAVTNVGNNNASAELYLYEDEIVSENLKGMMQISIETTSSEVYTFNWIPSKGGDLTLIAMVENAIPMDINRENDDARLTVEVVGQEPVEEYPDLSVNEVGIYAKGKLTTGKLNIIYVLVYNFGDADATAELYLYDNAVHANNIIGVKEIVIAGELFDLYVFNWIPKTAGEHMLTVKLENVNPEDSDSFNNMAQKSFIVENEEDTAGDVEDELPLPGFGTSFLIAGIAAGALVAFFRAGNRGRDL